MKHVRRNITFTSVSSILPEIQRLQRKFQWIDDLSFEIKTTKYTGTDGLVFTLLIAQIWCSSKACFVYNETFWDKSTDKFLASMNKEKLEQLAECVETLVSK